MTSNSSLKNRKLRQKALIYLFQAGFLLLCWQLVSDCISNPVIAPKPKSVAFEMFNQLVSGRLVPAAFATSLRSLNAMAVSFAAAALLALAARKPGQLSSFLDRCILFLRTIPNIAFIIILLFWLNRNVCVFMVCFLLLFPIVYSSLLASLRSIDKEWREVFAVYPHSLFWRLRYVYIPLSWSNIQACLVTSCSLAFKSSVMAEVLCQTACGIGRAMQIQRLDVNLAGVIGWVFWLVILVSAFDGMLKYLSKWVEQKYF